jgi:hypothetical protein
MLVAPGVVLDPAARAYLDAPRTQRCADRAEGAGHPRLQRTLRPQGRGLLQDTLQRAFRESSLAACLKSGCRDVAQKSASSSPVEGDRACRLRPRLDSGSIAAVLAVRRAASHAVPSDQRESAGRL